MKVAQKHPEEAARLSALESLELLDSLPEEEFDELTYLAATICQTPISLVSLVDRDRQWFKSRFGLSVTETPRDLSFCAHTILQDDLFEVSDSTLDPRFSDNPLVRGEPRVLFYAGIPLRPLDSPPIGTLCVIDHKPRRLTPEQAKSLRFLANQFNRLARIRNEKRKAWQKNDHLKYFKTAMESMSEGVVLLSAEGKVLEHNSAAPTLLGLTLEELMAGQSADPRWRVLREDGTPFPRDERPAMISLRTGKPVPLVPMKLELPDGSSRWLEVSSSPIFEEGAARPNKVVSTFRDVTETRKARDALVHSAKMSSLGRMATGLSHEVNNPLSVVIGRAFGIRKRVQGPNPDAKLVAEDVESIERAAARISKIIGGLSTFAKSGEMDPPHAVKVRALLTDTLDLFQEKLRKQAVDVRLELPAEELEVSCRPFQISQVVLNLILNSQYALRDSAERWIEISAKRSGNRILFAVTDSGARIPPSSVERLFEPFFTTKPVGNGVGLGLSIARGIIEGHQGSIRYAAEHPNTRFEFEIPLK